MLRSPRRCATATGFCLASTLSGLSPVFFADSRRRADLFLWRPTRPERIRSRIAAGGDGGMIHTFHKGGWYATDQKFVFRIGGAAESGSPGAGGSVLLQHGPARRPHGDRIPPCERGQNRDRIGR